MIHNFRLAAKGIGSGNARFWQTAAPWRILYMPLLLDTDVKMDILHIGQAFCSIRVFYKYKLSRWFPKEAKYWFSITSLSFRCVCVPQHTWDLNSAPLLNHQTEVLYRHYRNIGPSREQQENHSLIAHQLNWGIKGNFIPNFVTSANPKL